MKSLLTRISCFITTAYIIFGATLSWAQYDYIDISNPFLRKIPIAIPYFKPVSQVLQEGNISREASDLLQETLTFTGYFKNIDRAAFLSDPTIQNIVTPHIKFKNWTAVGAELLVTGGVLVRDNLLEMELRLFDTFKERLLIGKRYKGAMNDQRRMIQRFCGEIIQLLTGNRGIFDSKIVFVSSHAGAKEIYICDFDGYNTKKITNNKSINLSPDWSFDGRWISYTSYVKGSPDLFIRHLNEKRGAIFARKGTNISPAWVPGKFELAASLSFSGDPEIYLLTGMGKIIKRITKSPGIDVSPTWSPDGRKMAFVSKRSGSPQIYIKDLESGRTERLTYEGRLNTQPSWSPKGDQLAYSGMKDGANNIYVIGFNGKDPIQLTSGSGDNESPAWSPDGSLICFSSTREGTSRIYMMTSFGTDQRRLLSMQGSQSEPAWSLSIVNK